jgi:PAS domain-containing protein
LYPSPDSGLAFASGEGASTAAIRAVDWEQTPLGSASSWPTALEVVLKAMLSSLQPIFVYWGPTLVTFYNEGCLGLLSEKHPRAMGQRADVCWHEAWPTIGPQLQKIMRDGEPQQYSNVLVPIVRDGRLGDMWVTYSYSALFDDEGAIAGVLCIVTETTTEVRALRDLERSHAATRIAWEALQQAFMQAPTAI